MCRSSFNSQIHSASLLQKPSLALDRKKEKPQLKPDEGHKWRPHVVSAPNFLSLSNKRAAVVSVQLHPIIKPGSSMLAVPGILRGQGDINKEQSLDSQSHTHERTYIERRGICVPILFSETVDGSRSRHGMSIVNTAMRKQAPLTTSLSVHRHEEDKLEDTLYHYIAYTWPNWHTYIIQAHI